MSLLFSPPESVDLMVLGVSTRNPEEPHLAKSRASSKNRLLMFAGWISLPRFHPPSLNLSDLPQTALFRGTRRSPKHHGPLHSSSLRWHATFSLDVRFPSMYAAHHAHRYLFENIHDTRAHYLPDPHRVRFPAQDLCVPSNPRRQPKRL